MTRSGRSALGSERRPLGIDAAGGRHVRPVAVSLALALGLTGSRAFAAGFHVDEQDASATGRAGAVTADPNNASAIYYNPAGIASLEGVRVDVGAALVAPGSSFTPIGEGAQTVSVEDQVFVLPQAFISWRASEVWAAGLGFTAPFGLALEWPETSPGRTVVREADLRTFFITPALGANLSRWLPGLTLGAGVDLVPASVRLTRDIAFGSDFGSVGLSGTAFGLGARAGLVYRPPALGVVSFGLTYRSPVVLDFEGDADFDAPLAYRGSLPPDGEVATSVTLPQSLGVGVMVEAVPGWELELDLNWRGWSSYDRLDIELPNGEVESEIKDWRDTLTLRLGTEYELAERYALRLGFIWDQTPVPAETLDFQLPDADRIDLTVGFGAALSHSLRVDAAGMWVLPQERSTAMSDPAEPPVKGRFEFDAWILNVTLSVQLDAAPASAEPAPERGGWAARTAR